MGLGWPPSGVPKPPYAGRDIMAKVLVIDDEQDIGNLLDTLLSRKSYDVILAYGGRKGPFGENAPMLWC